MAFKCRKRPRGKGAVKRVIMRAPLSSSRGHRLAPHRKCVVVVVVVAGGARERARRRIATFTRGLRRDFADGGENARATAGPSPRYPPLPPKTAARTRSSPIFRDAERLRGITTFSDFREFRRGARANTASSNFIIEGDLCYWVYFRNFLRGF